MDPEESPHQATVTRNLRTSEDKADYARRAAIVEPVFGQMKVAKGAGPFRLRGQDQARPEGEWTLHVFRHIAQAQTLRMNPRCRPEGPRQAFG